MEGELSFDFHLYDYQPDDEFELMIAKLDSPVIKTLAPTRSDLTNEIKIDVVL